jgi:uncharacterized protein (DUF58 family)
VTLLSPSFMARLASLQVNSRYRLVGRFGGEHISRRYGNTVDFADFREYHPGDDFRRIDYHVLARLDQVLIKLYEADDDVTVRLLIDTSGSMAIGGKMEQAKRLAAALGFVSLSSNDSVSVHPFPGSGPAPRFSGRASVPALLAHLEGLEPSGKTPLSEAASSLLSQTAVPGITVLLSDLLTPYWQGLVRLRAGGSDLLVIHLTCKEDFEPEYTGDLELVDREDGKRLTVSITEEIARSYKTRVAEWRDQVKAATGASGGTYIQVDTSDDVEDLLLKSWRKSGVLR